MIFKNIDINNFRQYFSNNSLDLSCSQDKNIVVIGGKNGFGKTNLLLSIVWCLYGEKISQVDDNFKKEIRKEKNYSAFMEQSLNWKAKENGDKEFSVTIKIMDVQIPSKSSSFKSDDLDFTEIIITRRFDISTLREELFIVDKNNQSIYEDYEDKVNFINDFIIPIDAAKFVFFDAEKISEVANLSIKDEGSFINDAFNKVLGLDIYEQLIDDLSKYINSLKKHNLSGNDENEVNNTELTLDNKKSVIENIEKENIDLTREIEEYQDKINEYRKTIEKDAPELSSVNRDDLIKEKEKLEIQVKSLEDDFNDLGEIIPLVILSGKLIEVKEHLAIQEQEGLAESTALKNKEKIESFIESLFNKPPEPENSTMSLKDKLFFYEKAQTLGQDIFGNISTENNIDFEHDLTNSDKSLIESSLSIVDIQSKESIESIIHKLNSYEIQLSDITNKLRRVDADEVDEYISDLIIKLERFEENVYDFNRTIGANLERMSREKNEIVRLNTRLNGLLQKIKVSETNQIKITSAQKYIDVLSSFITQQKHSKKARIEKNILMELQKLMHKLKSDGKDFISEVEVNILHDGLGMKVSLYDDNDEILKKESLSQGEKQLYISSLIKAILKESLYPLPIFIDTPLGRLDDEHISNILEHYYPNLSNQVVLLSTNNEITPARYKSIEDHVSKSYLITNDGKNSSFVSGYFKGFKND